MLLFFLQKVSVSFLLFPQKYYSFQNLGVSFFLKHVESPLDRIEQLVPQSVQFVCGKVFGNPEEVRVSQWSFKLLIGVREMTFLLFPGRKIVVSESLQIVDQIGRHSVQKPVIHQSNGPFHPLSPFPRLSNILLLHWFKLKEWTFEKRAVRIKYNNATVFRDGQDENYFTRHLTRQRHAQYCKDTRFGVHAIPNYSTCGQPLG